MNKNVLFLLTAFFLLACTVTTAGVEASTGAKIASTVTAQPEFTPQNAHSAIVANSGGLNVRICPSTVCKVLHTISDGTRVLVIGTPSTTNGGTWVHIVIRQRSKSVIGYVNARYLEAVK